MSDFLVIPKKRNTFMMRVIGGTILFYTDRGGILINVSYRRYHWESPNAQVLTPGGTQIWFGRKDVPLRIWKWTHTYIYQSPRFSVKFWPETNPSSQNLHSLLTFFDENYIICWFAPICHKLLKILKKKGPIHVELFPKLCKERGVIDIGLPVRLILLPMFVPHPYTHLCTKYPRVLTTKNLYFNPFMFQED